MLGDCGNPDWFNQLRCYKVLVKGNHDAGSANYKEIFNEVYEGPVFISEKVLLSHEPIIGDCWCNIHGHDHANSEYYQNIYHLNVASNVINYDVISLEELIKKGCLSKIDTIHRQTINKAVIRKKN